MTAGNRIVIVCFLRCFICGLAGLCGKSRWLHAAFFEEVANDSNESVFCVFRHGCGDDLVVVSLQ